MIGSEKQIKWATDIRQKFVTTINQLMDEVEQTTKSKRPDQAQFIPVVREKIDEAIAAELAHDDAKYWIEKYARFDRLDARAYLSPIFKAVIPA